MKLLNLGILIRKPRDIDLWNRTENCKKKDCGTRIMEWDENKKRKLECNKRI